MPLPLSTRAARALGHALVDGALAGVAAGVIDAIIVLDRAGLSPRHAPAILALVVGLGALAGMVVGAPVVLVARALGRHPWLVAVRERLAEPGPRRIEALVALVGGALAIVAVAAAIAWVELAITARYLARGPAAALAGALAVAIGLAALGLATAALPPLGARLGRWPWAQRATAGAPGAALLLVLVAVVVTAVDRAAARLAPAWDAGPALGLAAQATCVLVIAAVGAAHRLGARRAASALAAAAALAAFALGVIGRLDGARGAVAERGLLAGRALAGLWQLTDDDGDGFADRFGARDCDDRDRRVHPHAIDVAGDGVDGNCAGGDPDPAALAAALAARAPADPTAPRRDIVLVTIDSVRADRTSLAGYRFATTPQLAALAGRGARFDRAYTPAPLTRRAVPAILYGRMAAALPFSSSRRWPLLLANPLPSLASTLTAAGYRTAAIVSHRGLPLSDATYRGFAEVIGLSDELVSRHHDNADQVIDRALAWLAAPALRPRFLWVHLIDPHYPYTPPPSAPRLGAGASAYDRELAFADAQLGRLLAALPAERTIVVVTADHGEAFGERHHRFHGRCLDDVETRVPLVIAAPGGPPTSTATPVSLVDLAPTLLELVGVETPAGMTGASLAATVRTGAPPPARPILTELFADGTGRELVAVHAGERKLVRDLAAATDTAYDLAADPRERAPLTDAAAIRALAAALATALDRELSALPAAPP
jgi:arylsulfatase A-like enzyme